MNMHRRWLQFSLRGFFVVLTIGCLWLGWEVERVQRRLRAIDAIGEAQGSVLYYGLPASGQTDHWWNALRDAPAGIWLVGPVDDELGSHLANMQSIHCLTLAGEACDADLERLERLTGASEIQFHHADHLSEAALARLKRKLPGTEIWITTPTRHVRYEP